MGQKTITGKIAVSREDYQTLQALAKEGVTSRSEILRLNKSVSDYRERYYSSSNALNRLQVQYNKLKEICMPFLRALQYFPKIAKLFVEQIMGLYTDREAQERKEQEARETARKERIRSYRSKDGRER